jgi:uncharacterized repeat protein (TIGR02543 family)
MNKEKTSVNSEHKKLFSFLLSLFSFLIYIGCQNPASPSANLSTFQEGKGSFSLLLSNRARTILPATPGTDDFAVYNLVFTPASGSVVSVDRTNANLATNPVPLNPGTYSLVVNAYKESGKSTLLARGTASDIVITAGANTSRIITLEALLSGGQGTFRWTITLPAGVTAATMAIAGGENVNLATTTSGSRSLNSGLYNLTFNLESPDGKVVWKELLYVYQNLESNFIFTFTSAHFNNPNYTVTYNYNDGITSNKQQSILHGGILESTKPADPTRSGYAFGGWFTDNNTFANLWNFNNPVIDSFTLYARWDVSAVVPEREFWAQNLETGVHYKLDAQMLAEGAHCKVWVEIKSGVPVVGVNIAQSMANTYDNDIYQKMMDVFSLSNISYSGQQYTDTMALADALGDNDGKFCILLLDIQDGYAPPGGSYVGGYFWSGNLYKNASLNINYQYSNESDMIYIDTYPSTPGDDDSNSTLAHEMQHMMYFVASLAARSTTSVDTWVTEGLSAAAEWVYTGEYDQGRINWYSNDPSQMIQRGNNFFVWDQYGNQNNSVLDDYATVNLFFQWLRLQSGGSRYIYKTIIGSQYSDYRAVLNAMSGYSDWETLLKTWLAANYIMAPTGPYGYLGALNLTARTVPTSLGTSIDLYPGEGVYSITNSTFTNMPAPGTNIRYAGLNKSAPALSDTSLFVDGALLTFNIDTVISNSTEQGITTGVASNVIPASGIQSTQNLLSGPYAVGAGDMLRQNGHDEEPSMPLPIPIRW